MVRSARSALSGTIALSLSLSCAVAPLHAQDAVQPLPAKEVPYLSDSASPFGGVTISADEAAAVEAPKLVGPVTPLDEESFDKYFYFHRPDTDLATAFSDLSECDGYARGLSSGYQYQQAPYPYTYTMAGAVGGAIGNLMVAAIFGSAEKRKLRRVNMRNCMSYKGYQRYGLPKDLWEKFNFEEGLDSVGSDERHKLLLQQAFAASIATPAGKVLEP